MSAMHNDYWLDVIRLEHEERRRTVGAARRAGSLPASGMLRRRLGTALIRLGMLVAGPAPARPVWSLPAHHRGAA